MAWYNFFRTKGAESLKSSGGLPKHIQILFNSFGGSIINEYLNPTLSYQFYHKISPLQGTIVKIATAISELPLVLRSESEPEKIEKNHDVLTLLNKPSSLRTKKQFLNDLAVSSLLTREIWIIARGPIQRPPLELVFVHPFHIDIQSETINNWPTKINVNMPGEVKVFIREEVSGGRFRYFDKTKDNELFPYIAENNDSVSGVSTFRGVSKLTSLKDELLSYAASIVGNTASIENQASPGGILSPDDDLDEKQLDQIADSMRMAEGALNNGKTLVMPFKVSAVFQKWAPKDMDYETLQTNVKMNIWRLYSIPLPLVNEKGQTFNNFKESQVAFYDESVNQAWSTVSDALKWAMETRFDLDGFKIGYNAFEVPALKARAIDQMGVMQKTNVLKTNEMRRSAGFEDISDGESIIVPANSTTLDSVIEGAGFDVPPPANEP